MQNQFDFTFANYLKAVLFIHSLITVSMSKWFQNIKSGFVEKSDMVKYLIFHHYSYTERMVYYRPTVVWQDIDIRTILELNTVVHRVLGAEETHLCERIRRGRNSHIRE